jgi:hypothetical protein
MVLDKGNIMREDPKVEQLFIVVFIVPFPPTQPALL